MKYCYFCGKETNKNRKFCSVLCNVSNINANKPIWKFNIDDLQHQIIEGCLISDGYLETRKGINVIPCFGIAQMETKLEYLEFLKEKLSLDVKIGRCKHFSNQTGKTHYSYRFRTRRAKELLEYYHRWYPNGKKIIPKDFKITPTSLYHWFIGDGSFYCDNGETKVILYTNGFLKDDVEWIQHQLKTYDINFNLYLKKFKGYDKLYPVLQMSNKIDVGKFFDFLPKNKVSCFDYKFSI